MRSSVLFLGMLHCVSLLSLYLLDMSKNNHMDNVIYSVHNSGQFNEKCHHCKYVSCRLAEANRIKNRNIVFLYWRFINWTCPKTSPSTMYYIFVHNSVQLNQLVIKRINLYSFLVTTGLKPTEIIIQKAVHIEDFSRGSNYKILMEFS